MLSEVTFLLLVYHKFLTPNTSTCFTLKIMFLWQFYWFN